MSYRITLPQQLEHLTFLIGPDSTLPIVEGQSEQDERGLIAWYTRDQLREVAWVGLAIKAGQHEKRLEDGEAIIIEARQRGDSAEVARLESHWVELLRQLTGLLDAQVGLGDVGTVKEG